MAAERLSRLIPMIDQHSSKRRHPRLEFRGTGIYWRLLLAFVIAIAILVGIIQNSQTIELKYLGWDLRTPLIVVLLGTIVATALAGTLIGVEWRRRRRRQLTEAEELRDLRGRFGEAATSTPTGHESAPSAPPRDPVQ